MRKAFTVSERVAIGAAIEAELAQRHGTNQHSKEDVENFPPPEGKTRDLVAKATVSATARPMSRPNRLNQNHCYKNHSAVSIAKTIGHVYCGLHNSCHAVLIVSINHTATPAAASPHGRPRAPAVGLWLCLVLSVGYVAFEGLPRRNAGKCHRPENDKPGARPGSELVGRSGIEPLASTV